MAIFKANYVRRNHNERANAKGSVRYIQHRRGKDGEKITRTLYGPEGEMARYDAYRMIDDASKGAYIYRFVLSPDPRTEDNNHDLDMRDIAMQTMEALEDRLGVPLNWVGATHSDYTPHLHAHVIAVIPHKLYVHDLDVLRNRATQACLEQRLFLDRALTRERERPYPAFSLETYAPYLDSLSDAPELRQGDWHKTVRYATRSLDRTWSAFSRSRTAGTWGRYEKSSSRHMSAGGSAPPQRSWRTCTCPRCHQVHTHSTRDPVHRCDACGLLLHRQRALRLNHSRGRELGWSR